MAKKWTCTEYDCSRDGGILLAEELLNNIREQDKMDLIATGGDVVFEICGSLQETEKSYVYRGEDGELLCIMGISRYVPDAAGRCVYMLGTNALNDISYVKQLLFTEARRVIGNWIEHYGIIFNAVNVDNKRSIAWLTRLGAIWLPEKIHTSNGIFQQFIITKGSVKDV